jgi:hypothetical protein
MSEKIGVTKVTLDTGKVVYLREIKIKHQELASQLAGQKCNKEGGHQFALIMSKEMIKMLICKIDEREIKPIELEDLDNLFTYREYNQLTKVFLNLSGEEVDLGKCQIGHVVSGGN